ncbi:MAG TPA: tRNA (cytidine(34)-2'-O)-methyltransferase [Candidatus Binatia bacterium]|nr:tRNA (cytidine(34)-2'-O)-methyltransferase [Candidatus Binatia bacterium]
MSAQPAERIIPIAEAEGAPLHVVLVEPEIPPNTGNIARLCAATDCVLHLVEPLGFSIDDRELKRAGLDYWASINLVVHPSFDAFLAAWDAEKLWFFSTRGRRRYTDAAFALGDALVFGKETAGLPHVVLETHPWRSLRIPMRDGSVRSLNLSTCVGIATYAALARLGFPGLT